ncbi:heterokaryon incompatibility protein-domain-containing protein [Fusarium flagelliforme]|uniref:heterokaryon incompatibility protein-domain-containing protein n=1 Tax=Fusarium flagelliforme TaxID=2675880 RepID=UPI001E8EB61D|nr:heterokaryon incompatibility protein-domain-containing protein [Fusarium flagelliforme]KAH7186204.1 heterokaryon incompatibility protein-domain-containing protein [Fusarium flagelliforme]
MSSVIDPKLIKSWLKHCTQSHLSCKPNIGGSEFVRGLQVIDCETGETIEAPGRCNYFALSYVWGKPAQPQSPGASGNPEGGATEWPKVVHDAVEVTRSLGERYLWVDKYCIDQDEGPLKDEQIAQMDKIYSGALLTLVAAAGEDSSYGLPGIGIKERIPMERFNIDNVAIIQMPPHLSAQISGSTWAERGWTYQEGYLSPRRLIFTDYEVAYLCNTMLCTESVKKPEMLSKSEMEAETSNFLGIIPSTTVPKSKLWHQLKAKQLPNYTRRKLTKTSDSINAVLGLFRTLKTSGIRQLHGIPIRRDPASGRVVFYLAWHHDVLAKRCPGFPSWSWSGWIGGIRISEPDISISDVRQIILVKECGDAVSLHDWFKNEMRPQDLPSIDAPKILRITAMTVWVSFEERSWAELNEGSSTQSQVAKMSFIDGPHAVLPIIEDVTAFCYAYMDEDVSLEGGVLGLILEPKSQKRRYTILLLRPDGDRYQRIGLVRVSGYNRTRSAAVGNSDPPIVYVNRNGILQDEFSRGGEPPLWLQRAVEKTITIS